MKKLILSISILGLLFIGCSDDDNPAASTVTFTEGTYNMTSATMYDNADCSGAGISGACMSDETATTAATCPSGMCMDEVNTTEATCTDGYWYTDMCMTDETATTAATCVEACIDYDTEELIAGVDEAACDAAGNEWMGWENFGWMSYAEDGDWNFTFGANGVFTDSDGEGGIYTVDGTTITVEIDGCCYDEDTDDCTDATTEATCTGDGEWEEAETHTGTLDAAAGTISLSDADDCCYDEDTDDCTDATTEATCTGDGEWESGCTTMVFTLSAD